MNEKNKTKVFYKGRKKFDRTLDEKKGRKFPPKKKKEFVRKDRKTNKIVDKRPKTKEEFDKGKRARWQKIDGTVYCKYCNLLFKIGDLQEYRCCRCRRILWIPLNMQRTPYMGENG